MIKLVVEKLLVGADILFCVPGVSDMLAGKISVRASVQPIDDECRQNDQQCADQNGQDDGKDG